MLPVQERSQRIFQLTRFLKEDIWRFRASKLTTRKLFWITQLRIVLLASRRFFEDKCELRASALTFYSLLSIVPVVALAFGIAKGFGMERLLQARIVENMADQPEVADQLIAFARALLENTKGGAVAGVGVVVLLWTVVKLLGNIEKSFNDIWGIEKGRPLGRKLADYLSAMLIVPVLFVAASSVTVLLTTRITSMVESLSFLGYAGIAIMFLLKLVPYAVIWVLFTFMFAFMPNTKVESKAALWGGIVAGTIYQLAQFAYIKFQIGVSSYGAIYGSLAALPLFLVWLQLSWLIVLFGAEISFAQQNVAAFEFEADCSNVSHVFKRLIAVLVTAHCVKAFLAGEKAPTAEVLAEELEAPSRLIRASLFELTEARLLSEIGSKDSAITYQPGCSLDDLTVAKVLQRLDHLGSDGLPLIESNALTRARGILAEFEELNRSSPGNLRLQELYAN